MVGIEQLEASIYLLQHLQPVAHCVGDGLQGEHTELVPAGERHGDVGQAVDDADILDALGTWR